MLNLDGVFSLPGKTDHKIAIVFAYSVQSSVRSSMSENVMIELV